MPGENGYADSGCANSPHVHEYLKEMNKKVLSHYNLITVGEASGVTLEEAKKYASADGSELNMVFQFEHVGSQIGRKQSFWKVGQPQNVTASMEKDSFKMADWAGGKGMEQFISGKS